MSLADVCWNISSVFIVITLGVIAILCVLTLFHHCLRFAFFRVVCVDRRVVHRRLDGKTLLDHIQTRRNRRDKTIKETK